MLITTRGIVFSQVKYGETSIIATIYTEHNGLQAFLVRGARSRHAKIRSAHLQHLTLVDMEVNHRSNKEIQYIKSLKIAFPFRDIPFNVKKSAVAVFLNEVLFKVIREEEANPELFNFLFNAIQFLDLNTGQLGLFHHLFLVRLSRFLGFFPRDNYSGNHPYFDLQEGNFCAGPGPSGLIAGPEVSRTLRELLHITFEQLDSINVPQALR